MEGDRALYLQPRVLRVEGVHILLGESRARVRPDGGRDAYALLRQDVERARVDVAVDEDDLALGALDQRDQQLEGGPGLPVEEDLLLRGFVGLYALFECVRTVLSVMNKRSAMVFLLRPRAISTAIYASLLVKP